MRELLTPEAGDMHWLLERRLAATIVVLAAALVLGAALVPPLLPGATILGLPLGWFLAGLGVPIALVALVAVYIARQAAIDEACEVAEE